MTYEQQRNETAARVPTMRRPYAQWANKGIDYSKTRCPALEDRHDAVMLDYWNRRAATCQKLWARQEQEIKALADEFTCCPDPASLGSEEFFRHVECITNALHDRHGLESRLMVQDLENEYAQLREDYWKVWENRP